MILPEGILILPCGHFILPTGKFILYQGISILPQGKFAQKSARTDLGLAQGLAQETKNCLVAPMRRRYFVSWPCWRSLKA